MNVDEFERIKNLIFKAELEYAKSKGVIESIENGWYERFGIRDVLEVEKKLNEFETQLERNNSRIENLYQKLLNSYDWDELEKDVESVHR